MKGYDSVNVAILFVDGLGFGENDRSKNPLLRALMPTLKKILGGKTPTLGGGDFSGERATLRVADATLGVEGLPQSGTGQTSLFCGLNAAEVIGRHFGPYPHSALKPLIRERSIFRRFLDLGKKVCFSNAYPKQFFEYIASGETRFTVTTLACMMLGIPLLGYDELVRDLAISADITRRGWKNLGYDNLTPIPAEEAGKQFCDIFQQNDLTMFEYFLTDHAGHSQSMSMAVEILEDLDRFLDGMLESFECDRSLLIITSDHGNIEDLSTKTHTFNPVPVILAGAGRDQIAPKIKCISDVVPSLMEFLLKFN